MIRDDVIRLHAEGHRDVEIARSLNRSRERIRQIRGKLGLTRNRVPARAPKPRICKRCGFTGCIPYRMYCTNCVVVNMQCSQCRQEFNISRGQYNRRLKKRILSEWFCSHRCFGIWAGAKYGFGTISDRRYVPSLRQVAERRAAAIVGGRST